MSKTMKIIQIIPAAPGWRIEIKALDGPAIIEPIAAWGLIEVKDTDTALYRGDYTEVEALIVSNCKDDVSRDDRLVTVEKAMRLRGYSIPFRILPPEGSS